MQDLTRCEKMVKCEFYPKKSLKQEIIEFQELKQLGSFSLATLELVKFGLISWRKIEAEKQDLLKKLEKLEKLDG